MTAEEYAIDATDEEVVRFYDEFKCTGFIEPHLNRQVMLKARTVLGYCRETYERRYIHSRSEEFLYQHKWTASQLSERLEGSILLAVGTLRLQGLGVLSTHEWCDDNSFVVAITENTRGVDRLVAVMSFCNIDGDHFNLFAPKLYGSYAMDLLTRVSENVANFIPYGEYDLETFLWTCGYSDQVDKDGYCIPRFNSKPAIPGSILFRADEVGMDILASL